jgi:hypothetical protein
MAASTSASGRFSVLQTTSPLLTDDETAIGGGTQLPDGPACLPGNIIASLGAGTQVGCVTSRISGKQRTDGALPFTNDVASSALAGDGYLLQGEVLRLDWIHNQHTVLYMPEPQWVGHDVIAYTPHYGDALNGIAPTSPQLAEESGSVHAAHLVVGPPGPVSAAAVSRSSK